jgi:hypothetical protein
LSGFCRTALAVARQRRLAVFENSARRHILFDSESCILSENLDEPLAMQPNCATVSISPENARREGEV